MKKIISLLMIFVLVFSMASCALVPAYDSDVLVDILENNGYATNDVDEEVQEGITGYIYAYKEETGDEIYYIYCENVNTARTVYSYINSKRTAKINEIKMEIEKIEYALYKSEGVSAAEKGNYYEQLVLRTEELEEVQNYSCGHGLNIVWYGTKQAIRDIRKG